MTPLQLSFTAFGPFPNSESINFNDLGVNPLFLINGPTGAGKTTILDAICFALYGRTTGDERSGDQMRCDLAHADTLTEVVFSFRIANVSYRIRRVPEQPRPKARGVGFTQQSSEAQLWQLDAAGEPEKLLVSNKVTEANQAVQQLLGLSVDQFRQVMVLPQGQFRKLLTAGSADREKIFSQLFQTGVYAKLEEALKRQALDLNRQLETVNASRQELLAQHDIDRIAELNVAIESANVHRHQVQLANSSAQIAFSIAEKTVTQAEQLDSAFVQLDTLITKKAELQTKVGAIQNDREQLTSIELAQSITGVYQGKVSAQAALINIHERLTKATTNKEQAAIGRISAEAKQSEIPMLQERQMSTQAHIHQLERYSALAGDFQNALNQQQIANKQFADAASTSEQKRAALHQNTESLEQWSVYQKEQAKQAEGLSAAQQSGFELTVAVDLAKQRDVLTNQYSVNEIRLAESKAAGLRLKAELDELEGAANRLERDWHLGQAALLSQTLVDGEACPVCGSLEHPSPQHSETVLPTQDQIKQARLQSSKKDQQLTEERSSYRFIKKELERLSVDLHECKSKLDTYSSLSSSEIELKANETKIQQQACIQADKELRLANDQIDKLNQKINIDRSELEANSQLLSRYQADKEVAASSVAKLAADLPEAFRESPAVDHALVTARATLTECANAIEQITTAIQKAQSLWQSQEAVEKAIQEELPVVEYNAAQAVQKLTEALDATTFADEAAFIKVFELADSAQAIKARVVQYDSAVTANHAAIEQITQQIGTKERPNISSLSDNLNLLKHTKEQASSRWIKADHYVSDLLKTQSRLDTIAAKADELDKAFAVVGTLSQVANGQTSSRISLQRFVLSVLLDDVLIEASQRLLLMSKGRYRLLRKEERSSGNVASGLDLEVEDTYSGRVRPVETLSGGEGFMAALALALGLSEVVQAYAGGIRLDVLFIDEGFGSLDPESLDLAIQTLMDLQQGGRMIGIISHVAELKEQMPLRIDIEASRTGSRIALRDH